MSDSNQVYITWRKGNRVQIGKHFHTGEFECQCKLKSCVDQVISLGLVRRLDRLRDASSTPIRVTSGYRCPEHNRAVGGVENSQHTLGRAADIRASAHTPGVMREKYAQHIFKAIGAGANFLHVDLRDDRIRRWTYG